MIVNRIEGTRLIKLWILAASSCLAFWGWYLLFFFTYYSGPHYPQPGRYALYSGLVFSAIILERLLRSQSQTLAPAYQPRERSTAIALRQLGFIAATVLAFTFVTKDKHISRAFMLSFFALLPFVFLFVNHYLLPPLTRQFFSGSRKLRTVLVGDTENVRRHVEWFQNHEELGMKVIGYIGNGPDGEAIEGLPQLAALEDLETSLRQHRPATAVFVGAPAASGNLIEHKTLGDSLGIRVVHVWDFQAHYGFIPVVHSEAGLQFLGFLTEPLESPTNRIIKRFFDLTLAIGVCLFVLPPLMALVWLAHRLQSPGPLFFAQNRRGQNGRIFRMLKFRTMHKTNPDESRQATFSDDRVFRFGRLMRKLSVDEVPQFINVLIGDMSAVGPRPHLPEHDERFASVFHGYHIRTFVKPGITGLAQVRGFRGLVENDGDVEQRAQSDLQYLEEWSLFLDASIVLQTATKMFFPPSTAY